MKTSATWLLSLLFVILPTETMAQNNIRSAFDAIIKCPEARITESHTLDKDPKTNVKTGQSDTYRFVLPANKMNLVRNLVSAFDKDDETAYSIKRGYSVAKESDIVLAVGEHGGSGVRITDPGYEYVYALYLAPVSEDPNGIYRYAYGMNFKEADGKIMGKLVITYATTLKHRQHVEEQKQFSFFRNFPNGSIIIPSTDSSQQSWFDTLMSCFQSMTSANSQTRIALAAKSYKLIRDSSKYPEVAESDKDAVREILKGMIADKEYSETVLNKLLNQCLVSLK